MGTGVKPSKETIVEPSKETRVGTPRPDKVIGNRANDVWSSPPFWKRAAAPLTFWTNFGFENQFVQIWLRFRAARSECHLRCGPYAWDLTKGSRVIRISRRQFAGVAQLAADFDKLFEALVPTKLGSQLLLDFSRLQVHTYRGEEMKFEMAQWPEADAAIEAYFENYQPTWEDLVFDIGAQCGVSTYLLSRFAGKVIAFEQESSFHELLARNVARHALAQVTVAPAKVPSLAELIQLYGAPAFCKVNLDCVAPRFLLSDAHSWTSLPIFFAARSKSKMIQTGFISLLSEAGFDITVHRDLGLIWARPGVTPDE